MIYITAMKLKHQDVLQGINVFLHHHPKPIDPQNPWKYVKDPGNQRDEFSQIQLPSGGNRVEAYLDIFFEEADYSPELFDQALEVVALRIEEGVRSPAKIECQDKDGRVIARVEFSVNNLDKEALMLKRFVFRELRAALKYWEGRNKKGLEEIAGGSRLKAAG